VNHKRLYRVYRAAGLCLKRKKRKHCMRTGLPLKQTTAANQEWALDFAHDVIAAGRTIRVLSVVDTYTRECLALEADTGFASRRVTRVLDEVIARRGRTEAIRCDQRPGTDQPPLPCLERWSGTLKCGIFSPANEPRTHTWKASTESFAKSACGSVGSPTCSTLAGRSQIGERSTTKNGRTAASTTERQPSLHS